MVKDKPSALVLPSVLEEMPRQTTTTKDISQKLSRPNSAKIRSFLESAHLINPKTVEILLAKKKIFVGPCSCLH